MFTTILIYQRKIGSCVQKNLNHFQVPLPGRLMQWGVAMTGVPHIDALLFYDQLPHLLQVISRDCLKQFGGLPKHLCQALVSLLISKGSRGFIVTIWNCDIGSCSHQKPGDFSESIVSGYMKRSIRVDTIFTVKLCCFITTSTKKIIIFFHPESLIV